MKYIYILSIMLLSLSASAEVTLTLKRPNGSTYWVERFDARAKANKWLAEQKENPDFPKGLTEVFSGSDNVEDTTHIKRTEDQRKLKLDAVRAFKDLPTLTEAQQTQVIQFLLKKELGE